MTATDSFEQKRIDPRLYLGILVFRWKLITVCFLYCLLGGVLYLQLTPKLYDSSCRILIYRDPTTQIIGQQHHWSESQTHIALLQSEDFNGRVAESLAVKWAKRLGDRQELLPPVGVRQFGGEGIAIHMGIRNTHPAYARAYLNEMIRQFRTEREVVKESSYGSAARVLEEELARLKEQIRAAEDDVIEFQRVNQMEYVQAKGALELQYLNGLVGRQQQLSTERWMLDVEYPKLKGASPERIREAYNLTRETGRVGVSVGPARVVADATSPAAAAPPAEVLPELVPAAHDAASTDPPRFDDGRGWQDQRVRLARLEHQRQELAANTQPDNPKLQALDDEIRTIRETLELSAEVEYARLRERAEAIAIQMDALEEAQRRWKNSYLMASRKGSDFRHLQLIVGRFETMYNTLYGRLNELRVDQEIKGEHFFVLQSVRTNPKAAWPDALKILISALVAGVGSGLGLAMLAYFFDDKVQSVSDVETVVGVPFLGGVPFWVHTDMGERVRPIVSEQHRSGAAEAYRALRTNVLTAIEKGGKNVVLMTSADSKEGKTLTVLNLALMIAKTGKRVLLLDMDLRRGVLHKSFEQDRTPGIVDALRERQPLSTAVRPTQFENVWFGPAGTVEKNTSELLHAVDLEAYLREVAEQYDYVLMDSAPVLRVTDTVILAGCPICCVIYVAHANSTSKPVIKYSLDMLGDAHVIGLIVNSIEMHKISSLYYAYQYPNYAYYSYAYAYGYDYDLYDEHGRRRHRRRGLLASSRRALVRWFRRTFMPLE